MQAISKTQAHRVFMYGTHKQLKNSVQRWLKQGIATPSNDWYEVKNNNAKQYQVNIKDGAHSYKTGIVVVPENNGYSLLAGSL